MVGAQLTGESYTQGSSPCTGASVHPPTFSLIRTRNKKVETVCAMEEHAVMQSTLTLQNEIQDVYISQKHSEVKTNFEFSVDCK